MNPKVHNQIVSFIWSIADDVLRDVFVRGKYRDIILPFTVLRRLDALLVPTKEKVSEANAFETLMNDADNIDTNLEAYLDGFSPNVQEIISKFKLRNQLDTMKEAGLTYLLIEKLCNKEINLSPREAKNSKGEVLPPLTNLGMGYVFEELIRKFNEENNEEAGEHFTPREIIKLMTHILFTPVKDKIKKGTYLIYDPACGSGGMLTEAEKFAMEVTNNKADFILYGQEVNPETYAICTSDMLIKGEKSENIIYGSTLSKDGFPQLHFDFMLSNPPYGKTWKIDEDAIADDRGRRGKEKIKDLRFQVGLPAISDGQLLFLMNMVSKMKHNTELGSRIATVHNGSALFTGDAGGGESEIRKYIIENDWLECIIALPKNIFYNTFLPLLNKTIKELKLDIDARGLKSITDAITWKNEDAAPVLKKGATTPLAFRRGAGGEVYEADSDLRDTENVPLGQDIHEYFEREVLQHIPDAWIDGSKTVKGYEISFTRYFYNYVPPRSIEEITAEIFELEKETEGILNEIVND
ncbi:MAG: SAM-dependent DNA methyltransferase [Bacteroidales bacterium]|nr:SAM-dependent DNA methyltransferase [Bacteroidales bacterium]